MASKESWKKRARRAELALSLSQSAAELWRAEAAEAHQLMLTHAEDMGVRVGAAEAELAAAKEKLREDALGLATWLDAAGQGHQSLASEKDAWRLVALALAGGAGSADVLTGWAALHGRIAETRAVAAGQDVDAMFSAGAEWAIRHLDPTDEVVDLAEVIGRAAREQPEGDAGPRESGVRQAGLLAAWALLRDRVALVRSIAAESDVSDPFRIGAEWAINGLNPANAHPPQVEERLAEMRAAGRAGDSPAAQAAELGMELPDPLGITPPTDESGDG